MHYARCTSRPMGLQCDICVARNSDFDELDCPDQDSRRLTAPHREVGRAAHHYKPMLAGWVPLPLSPLSDALFAALTIPRDDLFVSHSSGG